MNPFVAASPKQRAHERGGILITAIMVILVMLILAIPFLVRLSAESRSTERASRALAALNLAEAGVDKVMWWLNPSLASTPVGVDPEAIQWTSDGTNLIGVINNVTTNAGQPVGHVNLVLTPPVGVAPNPQNRALDSTGHVPFIAGNTVDRTVGVVLEQYYKSIFDLGFFVNDYFHIGSNFTMDAYDSRLGPYSDANSGLDAYFGTNGYYADDKAKDFGDASFVAGVKEIDGTFLAGGYAVEDWLQDPTGATPPDETIITDVINVDKITDDQRSIMPGEYDLPSVDVYDLPPKEMLGELPSLAEWFTGYDSSNPESSTGYYPDRLIRPPLQSEIDTTDCVYQPEFQVSVGGTETLTPEDSGIYTSFILGDNPMEVKNPAGNVTLNVKGDVVLYITGLGDAGSPDGRFFMGSNSTVNILPQDDGSPSSLTIVMGRADFLVQQGYAINQVSGTPSQFVVLGTDQFTLPPKDYDVNGLPDISKHLSDIASPPTPGLMWFEHGQSDGYFFGAVYVPQAFFTGTGQGGNHLDFYGSAISKFMDFKTAVDFHYDKALGDLNVIKGGFDFWRIVSWQEKVGN